MDLRAELLVYHGGRMKIAPGSAEYRGGHVAEVDVLDDYVCFFQLKKIGTETLGYDSVERMWYVTPGGTLGTDLREINDDADDERVRAAAKSGVAGTVFPIRTTGEECIAQPNVSVFSPDLLEESFEPPENGGHSCNRREDDGEERE
ncbi:hypothetical protein LINPERHAP2_LOCUS23902 [Linum perenne]